MGKRKQSQSYAFAYKQILISNVYLNSLTPTCFCDSCRLDSRPFFPSSPCICPVWPAASERQTPPYGKGNFRPAGGNETSRHGNLSRRKRHCSPPLPAGILIVHLNVTSPSSSDSTLGRGNNVVFVLYNIYIYIYRYKEEKWREDMANKLNRCVLSFARRMLRIKFGRAM